MRCGGMRERGLTGLPDAAGAWRRDGCVVLPGCLDGPALEAARRDLAAVYPSAGEYHTATGAGRSRVYAGGEPGAIIALPFPAAALRRVAGHGTIAARDAGAAR